MPHRRTPGRHASASSPQASIAQLVEQLIRNQQVWSSSLHAGSRRIKAGQGVYPFPAFSVRWSKVPKSGHLVRPRRTKSGPFGPSVNTGTMDSSATRALSSAATRHAVRRPTRRLPPTRDRNRKVSGRRCPSPCRARTWANTAWRASRHRYTVRHGHVAHHQPTAHHVPQPKREQLRHPEPAGHAQHEQAPVAHGIPPREHADDLVHLAFQ